MSKRNLSNMPKKEDSALNSHLNISKPYENPVAIVKKVTQAISPMRITQNLPAFTS